MTITIIKQSAIEIPEGFDIRAGDKSKLITSKTSEIFQRKWNATAFPGKLLLGVATILLLPISIPIWLAFLRNIAKQEVNHALAKKRLEVLGKGTTLQETLSKNQHLFNEKFERRCNELPNSAQNFVLQYAKHQTVVSTDLSADWKKIKSAEIFHELMSEVSHLEDTTPAKILIIDDMQQKLFEGYSTENEIIKLQITDELKDLSKEDKKLVMANLQHKIDALLPNFKTSVIELFKSNSSQPITKSGEEIAGITKKVGEKIEAIHNLDVIILDKYKHDCIGRPHSPTLFWENGKLSKTVIDPRDVKNLVEEIQQLPVKDKKELYDLHKDKIDRMNEEAIKSAFREKTPENLTKESDKEIQQIRNLIEQKIEAFILQAEVGKTDKEILKDFEEKIQKGELTLELIGLKEKISSKLKLTPDKSKILFQLLQYSSTQLTHNIINIVLANQTENARWLLNATNDIKIHLEFTENKYLSVTYECAPNILSSNYNSGMLPFGKLKFDITVNFDIEQILDSIISQEFTKLEDTDRGSFKAIDIAKAPRITYNFSSPNKEEDHSSQSNTTESRTPSDSDDELLLSDES